MRTVGDILSQKGRQVHTTSPQATVFRALELMAEHNVGALLVVEGSNIAGIVSERDYARKVILRGKSSTSLSVAEVMSKEVVCVSSADTVESCMTLMTEKHVRHLPVVDRGRLAGLVSIGDVVRAIIEDKQGEIQQLESYIYGVQQSS